MSTMARRVDIGVPVPGAGEENKSVVMGEEEGGIV